MKRLIDAFAGSEGRPVRPQLIAYLTVGDPGLEECADPFEQSVQLALECVRAGADVLELGVPFSDPFADGPVIAAASHRAVQRGGGLSATLRVAARVRAESEVPIVLFGYANPLWVMGLDLAVASAAESGVDALLVVDVPVDAASELRETARNHRLGVVPLLAPTSTPARVEHVQAARATTPFVYYVSVAGITGAAAAPLTEASARAAALHTSLALPVVIGFGIDGVEKAVQAAQGAQGVVVGSALVKAIAAAPPGEARLAAVHQILGPLRAALP